MPEGGDPAMQTHDTPVAGCLQIPGLGLVLLLSLLFVASVAAAQEDLDNKNPFPLRPADTSSPRATLHSFLSNISEAVEDWSQHGEGTPTPARLRAWNRAFQTLDFSTTPDAAAASVRTPHLLFLKEILDRIELPPENQIPGEKAVAEADISQWTIPDTPIKIRRIEHGPRAGEFLFSADTVRQLDGLYRRVRHLPYRPGASVDLYERWIRYETTQAFRERQVRRRLRDLDTSSPRATFEGFLENVNRAYEMVMRAETQLTAEPPAMGMDEAREVERRAGDFLRRGVCALDLSKVPEALRDTVGVETALQFKEIFDRMYLPPLDTVPGIEEVAAAGARRVGDNAKTNPPFRWRVPNTSIEIVEITEGEQRGQFLFSASSVSRAGDFYTQIRELPYREDGPGAFGLMYRSPDKSAGFYEFYASTPGYLIPHVSLLGGWLDGVPDALKTPYAGQRLWQWIVLFFCVLAMALAAYLIVRLTWHWKGKIRSPWDAWLQVLAPLLVAYLLTTLVKFIDVSVNVTGPLLIAVRTAGQGMHFLLISLAAFVFVKAVAETVIAAPRIRQQASLAALLRIAAHVFGFLVAAWILIGGIRSLGADLIPLLAGLGVGGLAVALAAQSIIANFIGGLILLVNKPVRVGDYCRYGEDPSPGWLRIGTVEEIGLISTRLRGVDRTVTTIPNAEFAKMHIVNLTKRDRILYRTTLALRYETSDDQLRFVLAQLRELLFAHPRVTDEKARVRFLGFGDYSLDVEIFAYVNTSDRSEFLAVREDLNLRIMKIIEKAGTDFAFPSQTIYQTEDSGLDNERRQAAEKKVREWASAHRLPFPEFDAEYRKKITDTLDYPPEGSPKAD